MKVRVVEPFHDKFNLSRLFTPGEVLDLDADRAGNIVARGLGEYVESKKPKAKKKKEE